MHAAQTGLQLSLPTQTNVLLLLAATTRTHVGCTTLVTVVRADTYLRSKDSHGGLSRGKSDIACIGALD